ncbi:apoptosis-enhancing nuclease-like [Pelodytes ibericus]
MKDSASTSLFHGFSGSSQYLKSSHAHVPLDHLQTACVQNCRRSRKHQRFLKHKAFLQQSGPPSGKEEGSQAITENKDFETNQFMCNNPCEKVNVKALDAHFSKLREIKTMLGSLPGVSAKQSSVSVVSATDVVSADGDYDSGLSLPGSLSSSRRSSPVPCMKPGKCVAVDCEMVGTGPGARTSELARCSVVNYGGEVVYDKYIKPELPVTDYRTRWSGITRHHMKHAIPFKTAQKEILMLLKDKRVVGHALHNDFKALKYSHPTAQIRDTSKMIFLNQLAGLPPKSNVSLKKLAECLLHKKIQVGKMGHSSVEDAQACMELYKLVEEQWEHGLLAYSADNSSPCPANSSVLNNHHYMDDQYWPPDLNENFR